MPRISDVQIATHAKQAGLQGSAVVTAVAVALAESGGNTEAHNKVPPDDSYGLWQINMLGRLGPDRRQRLGLRSNSDLFDPAINAKAMSHVSSTGSNWKPWTTYTSGAYRMFVPRAEKAVKGIDSDFVPDIPNPLDPLEPLDGLAGKLMNRDMWIRVGWFVAGAIVVGVVVRRSLA